MTQLLKAVLWGLFIALSLTSDTASYATQVQSSRLQAQVNAKCLQRSSVTFAGIGQRPRYSEYQNLTFQPAMPLYESTQK